MSYVTWDWSRETGTGNPSALEPRRVSPLMKNENDAGYVFTSPLHTRDYWIFSVSFALIRPQGWVYLVDLFHAHRGGLPFYFLMPWGLYGYPEPFDTADPGGVSPWSSEVEIGYGEGPTWLVRFNSDQLPVTRLKMSDNYWATSSPIELITV